MSEFSEYCRQLLANSGSNVYQIANHFSLDRTSIQRMIRGERLPSRKFVRNFCSHLRINPIQQIELLKLYDIEKIGKTAYLNQCYIKNLIEHLSFLENNAEDIVVNSSEFCLNIPTSYHYFFFVLKKLFSRFHGRASIKHLITLNSNPSNSLYPCHNIEIMSNILPIIQLLKDIYHPSYLYSTITCDDEKLMVMPYYIITSQNVLLISSDFKNTILYSSLDIVKKYRQEFFRIFQMAKPFMEYADNPLCIMNALEKNYKSMGLPSHTLEFHPCLYFMDIHLDSEKESFHGLPNAKEYINALQEMYKIVSAATPPPEKSRTQFRFFQNKDCACFVKPANALGNIKI